MPYFHFRQNNSGGSFTGPAHSLVIEADNEDDAIERAGRIDGVYFNGVEDGMDCECCGDRWYPPYDAEGDPEPMIYGQPVAQRADEGLIKGWNSVLVVHKDGREDRYNFEGARF